MKKKIFILFAFIACMTTTYAQWNVGGSFGFTSTTIDGGGDDESGSSFKIIPDIGYQIDSRLSVGVQVGYSHGIAAFGSLTVSDLKSVLSNAVGAYSDINNDDIKLNGFTISPYVRYVVWDLDRVNVFFEGYVGYNNITTDDTPSNNGNTGDKTKVNAFELGLRPGVAFKISDRIDLLCKMGAIGYMSAKEKESDMSISRFGVSADTYNLLLGFNFHF